MSREAEVDKEAWAVLLADMLETTGATREHVAIAIGRSARSIYRWLSQETSVTLTNVRDVARALGYNPAHVLARLGWLSEAEAGMDPHQPLEPLVSHPELRRVASILADEYVPQPAKNVLLKTIADGTDNWLSLMSTGPTEPSITLGNRTNR